MPNGNSGKSAIGWIVVSLSLISMLFGGVWKFATLTEKVEAGEVAHEIHSQTIAILESKTSEDHDRLIRVEGKVENLDDKVEHMQKEQLQQRVLLKVILEEVKKP